MEGGRARVNGNAIRRWHVTGILNGPVSKRPQHAELTGLGLDMCVSSTSKFLSEFMVFARPAMRASHVLVLRR